jgi:hypothetical protein
MRRFLKIREDEVHRAAIDIHCHTSEMPEVAAKFVGGHAGQGLQLERERQLSDPADLSGLHQIQQAWQDVVIRHPALQPEIVPALNPLVWTSRFEEYDATRSS